MTKASKKIGTCNLNPRVWQAIWGCEGRGAFVGWEQPTTMHGSATRLYGCAACRAMQSADRMTHPQRQALLTQLQDLAGVSDYRYQGTERVNGRPSLINRRTGARWAMPSILERWTDLTPSP